MTKLYFAHESAYVDEPASIGTGTRIWHYSHVMSGAVIGENCVLGQNVFVGTTARIGNHVRIQNNVSVYDGVVLEDEVFCGPSSVFTNVINPRAELERKDQFQATRVGRGTTIGANATIICGTTLGRYAFIAAGAVVTQATYPDYALLVGVPARRVGWMSRHGHRLHDAHDGVYRCSESGLRYRETTPNALQCIDLDE